MTDTEKLYETLGELLYAVTMADGIIKKSEKESLKKLLKGHSWADEIQWSFQYEKSKQNSIEDLYNKVIAVCTRIGPSPIYNEFIKSMETIANADNMIDNNEQNIINSFSKDLIERFRKDVVAL